MPPPPPPSPSYLWVIGDSDSDEEEKQDTAVECSAADRGQHVSTHNGNDRLSTRTSHPNDHQQQQGTMQRVMTRSMTSTQQSQPPRGPEEEKKTDDQLRSVETPNTTASTLSADRVPEACSSSDSEQTMEEEVDQCRTSPPNQKKRKNKKKKKNRKKSNNKNASQTTNASTVQSSGNETQTNNKKKLLKAVSFGTVNVQEFERCIGMDVVPGEGSWPLGMKHDVVHDYSLALDGFEAQKQERLRERLQKLRQTQSLDDLDPELIAAADSNDTTLETRMYDYKSGKKNPLFYSLPEQERMKILLSHSSIDTNAEDSTLGMSALSTSPTSERKSRMRSRSRSGSFSEQFNDVYTQSEVHSVRNELERLRNSRSSNEGKGCNCRKLQVYLPPPGGGGKKAQRRRMSDKKVKEELKKRHLLNMPEESRSREELELLLHKVVEDEPCCLQDCPCVQHGIECQENACSCWCSSHQTQSQKLSCRNDFSPESIRARCGNKYGMDTVDLAQIDAHRAQFLACREVEASAEVGM